MSDGVKKKIPIRSIKSNATIKIQGEDIPILKSVHVGDWLFLDVLLHGQRKTVLKERPLNAQQKIERAMASSALSDFIHQYGKIKKFAWNEITLQSGKSVPMALYIEILNKALQSYEATNMGGGADAGAAPDAGTSVTYNPPVEPVFGAWQQHYRYSFYEVTQKHLRNFLPKVGYLYHPVNDTLTEVMETVDVRFEQVGDALEHWEELTPEERTTLKRNLMNWLQGFITLANETGHILDLGAGDDSILHASRVIIDKEFKPMILYLQRPFIIPWKLMAQQHEARLPILEQEPKLHLHPRIQTALQKQEYGGHDILVNRLQQAGYLESFFRSLTQLKFWLDHAS